MLNAAISKSIPDDGYESNDTFLQARFLELGSHFALCSHNDDWYKLWLPADTELTVALYHEYQMGRLAVILYDSDQNTLNYANYWLNDLQYFFQRIPASGYYYLRVYGVDHDLNDYYELYLYDAADEPGYNGESVPYEFLDYSGSVNLGLGDDNSETVPLGFDFKFYDQIYEAVRVSANGYLTFGSGGGEYRNLPMPIPLEPQAIIAPFWDDILPPLSGGGVYYKTAGSPGDRKFIATWANCRCLYLLSPTPGDGTFQAVLSEKEGTIQFNYQDVVFDSSIFDYGLSATVGLENETGAHSCLYSFKESRVNNGLSLKFYPHDYNSVKASWNLYE